ncbi:MAG: LysR family transcriptional regulator [Adlercreutzia equolifaciens]
MKTLVATVDAGSMTKAAKALYLTTPALMQRIKSLEAELGFSLLIRSKLGVSPTKTANVCTRHSKPPSPS